MMNEESVLTSRIEIDDIAYSHLIETSKWAKFLAIVGMILSSLLVVIALFAGTFMSLLMRDTGGSDTMSGAMVSIVYIAFAAFYFFTSLYLFRFAVKMRVALNHNDQDLFNVALSNQRTFYKIIGILMIIYLVFIALAILVFIFAVGTAGLGGS